MSPLQDFADFLKDEIDTSKGALDARYSTIAQLSQKVNAAHADRDSTKVRISTVNNLSKLVSDVEYEEATLHIYTEALKRFEEHRKDNTLDAFVKTLLKSLSREIGENNFGNSKISEKDKAYAEANFYMFKKIIPYVGYVGNE